MPNYSLDNKQQRIELIDIMKGIGITLVVFGHLQHEIANFFLNSITMPIFFFCSGYVAQSNKRNQIAFIKKRFFRLIRPYFIWSIILFLFWYIADSNGHNIKNNVIGIIYGSGSNNYMDWGLVMWFLPCLFLTSTIHSLLQFFAKKLQLFLTLILCTIGFIYSYYYSIMLPWSLNIAFVMILFYQFGYYLKSRPKIKINIWHVSALLIIWLLTCINNGLVSIYVGKFGNPILFIICGTAGILCIFLISQIKLLKLSIFQYLGKRSFFIFLFHLRCFTFIKAIQLYIFKMPLEEEIYYSFIYTILTLFILSTLNDLFTKKIPWLFKA